MRAARVLLPIVLVAVAAGCSDGPSDAPGSTLVVPTDVVARAPEGTAVRIRQPPNSVVLAHSRAEPGQLRLPTGPAPEEGVIPIEVIRAERVSRRFITVPGEGVEAEVEAYVDNLVEAEGFVPVFECRGLAACGGIRFVSSVFEDMVTAADQAPRARLLIALSRPGREPVRHLSLQRRVQGWTQHATVTVSRSDNGPVVILVQATE